MTDTNRLLGQYEEGVALAKEALEIYKRFNDVSGQARSWGNLAWLLYNDNQLTAAEETASQSIDLLSVQGDQYGVCNSYQILGIICRSRGDTEKAIKHHETAIKIASSFNWLDHLIWNHCDLAKLFSSEKRFEDAHVHIERAKLYAVNRPYQLARAMGLEVLVWNKEGRLEEAKSGVLRAIDAFEKLGATKNVGACRRDLGHIAWSLYDDNQLDAAEEAALQVISILPGEGDQTTVCSSYVLLGLIYHSRGEKEKAIQHFETAIGIASSFDLHDCMSPTHLYLVYLFSGEKRFNDAHAHIEHAKSHAINRPHSLAHMMRAEAQVWKEEGRFEEAKSGVLRAIDAFEKLGKTKDAEGCRGDLRTLEEAMNKPAASREHNSNGEFLETMLLPTPVDSPPLVSGTRHHPTSLLRRILPRTTNPA